MLARSAIVLALLMTLAPAAGAAPWSVGVAVQYDRANLSFDPSDDLETSPGGFVGAGLEVTALLGDRLGLVFAPTWHARGGRIRAAGDPEELAAKLRYFELPLWMRLDLGAGRVRPYLLAGASFGLRTSARVQRFVEGRPIEEYNIAEDTRRSDVSWLAGAGLAAALSAGQGSVFVEATYTRGLRDINRTLAFENSVHQRGFQFRAGLRFPLGGSRR